MTMKDKLQIKMSFKEKIIMTNKTHPKTEPCM